MNMPLLKIRAYSRFYQNAKIEEEYEEFKKEPLGSNEEIEESLDIITAIFTKLTHENSKEELEKAIGKHYEKLKSRGWETKGTIKIELEEEE